MQTIANPQLLEHIDLMAFASTQGILRSAKSPHAINILPLLAQNEHRMPLSDIAGSLYAEMHSTQYDILLCKQNELVQTHPDFTVSLAPKGKEQATHLQQHGDFNTDYFNTTRFCNAKEPASYFGFNTPRQLWFMVYIATHQGKPLFQLGQDSGISITGSVQNTYQLERTFKSKDLIFSKDNSHLVKGLKKGRKCIYLSEKGESLFEDFVEFHTEVMNGYQLPEWSDWP